MIMNREGKAEVQVTPPGHTFPFGSAAAPTHPHINQWCRFSIPERLPLKPFRQDRLIRLPLPPSLMATSKVASNTGAGFLPHAVAIEKKSGDIDPFQKIHLLEKNLIFVQENHALMLKGLHEEIADLKQKNRELLFEIVTGMPAIPNDDIQNNLDKDISVEQKDKIDQLEKEVKKLKGALKDAMKANSSLTNQLQLLKREQYSKPSSRHKNYSKTPPDSAIDDGHQLHSPSGPSPQIEEYSDTLRQIQRAANNRNTKRDDRRYRNDEMKSDWSEGYVRNGNGYQYHHHHRHHHQHQPQKSPQQRQQQQARLPRLPLRNQQNYTQQYEGQYRQRSSHTLPSLKQPLVPVMDHRLDKPRKSRGPRAAKLTDQVTNG